MTLNELIDKLNELSEFIGDNKSKKTEARIALDNSTDNICLYDSSAICGVSTIISGNAEDYNAIVDYDALVLLTTNPIDLKDFGD